MTQSKFNCLPLGREYREGIVSRMLWLFRVVDEKGYGRFHVRMCQQRQHCFRIGRAFDQNAIGGETFQRRAQTSSRTGAVVTNAEDVGLIVHGLGVVS